MGERFTKEQRETIVREFATRHNGIYNPKLFLAEVARIGSAHPAYGWFEWDDGKASTAWRVEQARDFVRDLRISFAVEDVLASSTMRIVQKEIPLVLSPVEHRHHGGGYLLTDPSNPDHMAEHCRQGATALSAWLGRYGAAVEYVGGSAEAIETLASLLSVGAAKAEIV